MIKVELSNKKVDLMIKVELSPSTKYCVICFIKNPLKMLKKAFYLILNAPFILKIFKFLSSLFMSFKKNGLIRKIRLTLKFITP